MKNESLNLKKGLSKDANYLIKQFKNINQEELQLTLQNEISNRFSVISNYSKKIIDCDYVRKSNKQNIIFTEGSTTVSQYGTTGQKVLIIPSLINRSYVLDISPQNSFAQDLSQHSINPILINWGEPDISEYNFSLSNYVKRICKIIDIVKSNKDEEIILAGHCMGGLLALQALNANPDKIKAIAFLSTPWNFKKTEFNNFKNNISNPNILDSNNPVSSMFIQSLFCMIFADNIYKKMLKLSKMSDDDFYNAMIIENWASDGISVVKPVWEEICQNWILNNSCHNQNEIVKGDKIIFNKINKPAFFAIANNDKIAPKLSSLPLSCKFDNNQISLINSSHIEMITNSKVSQGMWQDFVNWINRP